MTSFTPLLGRTAFDRSSTDFPLDPVDHLGANLYGRTTSGNLYYSDDHGTTWYFAALPPAGVVKPLRLIATDDSEVLLADALGVWKSTNWGTSHLVSWSQVLDVSNESAYMLEFGFDGDGTKFIITHYSSTRQDSRYVWISTDQGDSWSIVWDSYTDAPNPSPADSHLHGVCYDPWDDLFYLSEGHGTYNGIYVSSNDGATWSEVDDGGLNQDSAPTVLVATDNGIVFGSDNGYDGVYVLPRGEATIQWVWEWESVHGQQSGQLNGFANRGVRDASTGIVYIGYQSDRPDLGAIITASDGVTAGLVWTDTEKQGEYSNLVAHDGNIAGGSDRDTDSIYFAYTAPSGRSRSGYGRWNHDGTAGTAAITQDLAAYDSPGDFGLRLAFAPDAYGSTQYLMCRNSSDYLWTLHLSGSSLVVTVYDAVSGSFLGSRMLLSLNSGEEAHVWYQVDADGEAVVWVRRGSNVSIFGLDSDANWVRMPGSDTVTVTEVKQGSSGIAIGAHGAAYAAPCSGDYFRAIYFHGINVATGTIQLDADFTQLTDTDIANGYFTEDSANAATVTFQGDGNSFVPAAVTLAASTTASSFGLSMGVSQ